MSRVWDDENECYSHARFLCIAKLFVLSFTTVIIIFWMCVEKIGYCTVIEVNDRNMCSMGRYCAVHRGES